MSSITRRDRESSLSDRAVVKGVRRARKNRRVKSRESGSLRHRASWIATRVAAPVLAVAALGYGGLEAWAWAKVSPRFALERFELRGPVRAEAAVLTRLSGLHEGDNLFVIDTEQVRRLVETHPWVAAAIVSRRFPHTVQIDVVEHEPRLLLALGHLYYANERGDVVKRYSPGERAELPIVTGLSRHEMETDDVEARVRLGWALRFLDARAALLGDEAPRVTEIHLDPVLGLSFRVDDDDARVVIGAPPFEARLERLREVRASLAERRLDAEEISLIGERRRDRAVVKLAQRASP